MLAFVFTAGKGGKPSTPGQAGNPAAAVTVAAPPSPNAATAKACLSVFEKLPVQLGGLNPRKTATDSSYVAAWGNPAIVFRCGVSRPAVFGTGQAAQLIDVNGIIWQPEPQKDQVIFTAVDRSVYLEVTVPSSQTQPLSDLSTAVAALPQRCTAADASGRPTTTKLPICGG
ncbi:DUF3515 domain-containing protein [Jatrophihabitans telluris]|uniref:DUF3515 domain-containing protein n=1 Tax=Jatrophihabitans telluris TaxID=2038343 RepID=A0ABY4R4G0_9ACTN|nr:DUF3515 domain-containing protein [Jatrophihabitans telluris]